MGMGWAGRGVAALVLGLVALATAFERAPAVTAEWIGGQAPISVAAPVQPAPVVPRVVSDRAALPGVAINAGASPRRVLPAPAADFAGRYLLEHDGWIGELELRAVPGSEEEGGSESCRYRTARVEGTYLDDQGQLREVRGTVGGRDPQRDGDACPVSPHRIQFTIAFAEPQDFEGYLMSWTRDAMAGYTFRGGRPAAWFAEKR